MLQRALACVAPHCWLCCCTTTRNATTVPFSWFVFMIYFMMIPRVPYTDSVFSSSKRWQFFVEIGLWSIHPFPGVENGGCPSALAPRTVWAPVMSHVHCPCPVVLWAVSATTPSWYLFFSLAMLLRLLLLARLFLQVSAINSPNGRFIGYGPSVARPLPTRVSVPGASCIACVAVLRLCLL